jgi:hypothetical protein
MGRMGEGWVRSGWVGGASAVGWKREWEARVRWSRPVTMKGVAVTVAVEAEVLW